ncbi:RluA family pseudouridine synthase [Asticcacaulis sp. ZE23SCel15]|uniref:RluA family pseudouridine synthase n=1 Tax=Asticcacaulis sp. ZE23SCel15 TaxID=3059027 RepID=UPI00265F6DE7|nr:RluA family pseudouridine synthase [Asticcacaulis sp. ZE23SCel15]WKL57087.1 RluA family pseudouridine synthase [Asticcacaulis sp. ZE23SCel15]
MTPKKQDKISRKKASRHSPQHQAAIARREAGGGRKPQTPKNLKAIDRPIALSEEAVALIKSMLVYEDAEIMGFNKIYNLSSQGGRGPDFHNLDDLLWAFAKSNGKKPRLIHRLDRDTSGIILVAKTKPAASFLGKAMIARQFHKTYLLVVSNPHNLKDRGVIDVSLRREDIGREAYSRVCEADHPDALESRTHYEVISRNSEAALVVAKPYTGRMHQIRVHMAHLGCPIAGDPRYGGALSLGGRSVKRLMLHAAQLEFPHPAGGKKMLSAPVHEDIVRLCADLELDMGIYT